MLSLVKAWAMYGYKLVSGIPSVKIPVYTLSRVKVDERVLYGPMAKAEGHMVIRMYLPKFFNSENTTKEIRKYAQSVTRANPALRLAPTPDGWCKLDFTGDFTYVDLLFINDGAGAMSSSDAYKRTKLLFRGNRNSKDLGTYKTSIVEGGLLLLLDGQSVISRRALDKRDVSVPASCFQWTGYEDASRFLKDKDNWGVICKGMCRIVEQPEFYRLCRIYKLDPRVTEVIVPAITVKFGRGAMTLDMQFSTMQLPIVRMWMTLGLQPAIRLPKTPYGEKVILATWKSILLEIREAYEDKSGRKVMAMISSLFKEEIEDEDDPVARAETAKKLQEMGSTLIKMAYLPRKGEVFLNKTLPTIFEKKAKSVRLPGVTAKCLAIASLGRYQIILPKAAQRVHGCQIGDRVSCFRYPNTGIECFEAIIVGFTNEDCVFVNPTTWAERCAGDMDGDTIAVALFSGIFDMAALESKYSTKKSAEKKEVDPAAEKPAPLTLADVIARQAYIKMKGIPDADNFITALQEHGMSLDMGSDIMQQFLDGLKNGLQLPNVSEIAKVLFPATGLGLKAIYKILKGNFGDNEREVLFRYNALVKLAQSDLSIVPWLRELSKELFYIGTPTQRINESHGDDMVEIYNTYRTIAVEIFGREDFKVKAKYWVDKFIPGNVKLVEKELRDEYKALIETPGLEASMVKVHNAYDKFTVMLRDRDIEEAYTHIRTVIEYMESREAYGKLLKALWIAITYGIKTDGMKCTNLDTRKVSVKIAGGYGMFSYFPILLGEWELKAESDRLGGLPDMDIVVVPVKDIPSQPEPTKPTDPTPSLTKKAVVNLEGVHTPPNYQGITVREFAINVIDNDVEPAKFMIALLKAKHAEELMITTKIAAIWDICAELNVCCNYLEHDQQYDMKYVTRISYQAAKEMMLKSKDNFNL